MASNVRIDIAAEFVGKPAFDKAGKSVTGLEKAVGKLGKQFAGLFAVSKVVAFGKASAQAFMEDQRSAAALANTVKNLGLAFANPQINDYIQKLETATGIVDDQLRPAMQKLLTTTGSITKSQELLGNAIDISRGSGVDLGTVVQDLSNAYVGNTKGLRKYALGLTQTELKTMSFTDIQKKFNAQFGGASQAYLETYAGKLDVINVAADNAKETIGKGLLDAFTMIASSQTDIQGVADAFQNIATEIANMTVGIAKLGRTLINLPGVGILKNIVAFGYKTSLAKQLANYGAPKQGATGASTIENYNMGATARANAVARKKAEADAAKRAKELAAAQNKQTKALQDQAKLKKAQGVFDLQQIELVAALQGKLSEEDKKRVEAQLALLNGNVDLAKKLTDQIIAAQDPTGALAKMLKDLGDTTVKDPFSAWLDTIKQINDQIALMKSLNAATVVSMPATSMPVGSISANGFAYSDATPGVSGSASQFGSGTPWAQAAQNFTVSVQVDGKEIASALANTSASGTSSFINRNLGYFTN